MRYGTGRAIFHYANGYPISSHNNARQEPACLSTPFITAFKRLS